MVARGEISSNAIVQISAPADREGLSINEVGHTASPPRRPAILIVDDNRDLLLFLATELKEAGWEMLTADNAAYARRLFNELRPGAVLLDYMLGEDDGLALGLEIQQSAPDTKVVMMTGGALSEDELVICGERNIPILLKPFLAQDILNLMRGTGPRSFAAAAGAKKSAESS
jgi:DNA-binding response OmpR family regulator